MDINILLALQDFRNGIGGIFLDFLSKMTYLGEMNTVLIINALIYWCIKKDIPVMCAGIAVSVAVAVYAAFKQYPVDYDSAGQILVDGAKMAKDTYKGAGWCIGFLAS